MSHNDGMQGTASMTMDGDSMVTEGQGGTSSSSNQWNTINPMFNPMGFPNPPQFPVNSSDFDAFGMNPQLQQQFMQQQMTMMHQQAMFGFDPTTTMMMGFDQFDGGFDAGYGQGFHRGRGGYRGRSRGRGGYYDARQHQSHAGNVPPPPIVPGAPSAPKAMLIARGRGRGFARGGLHPMVSTAKDVGPEGEQRGRERSKTPRNGRMSVSRSPSEGRKSPMHESVESISGRSRSPSAASGRYSRSRSSSSNRSSSRDKQKPSRSHTRDRSLSPERSHRKSSKSKPSRHSRSGSDSEERSSRRSSHKEKSSRDHGHRSHSRDSGYSRDDSNSHSHRDRHHKHDSKRRRHSSDSERSHRHRSSHRIYREREYSPSDRGLSPVHEDDESQHEKNSATDQESRSPSPQPSKSRRSRSSHTHRKHHRSGRHHSQTDEDHRRRHSKSYDEPSLQSEVKDGDTRRRSVRYEDDIETTARHAELEREQQRWK